MHMSHTEAARRRALTVWVPCGECGMDIRSGALASGVPEATEWIDRYNYVGVHNGHMHAPAAD